MNTAVIVIGVIFLMIFVVPVVIINRKKHKRNSDLNRLQKLIQEDAEFRRVLFIHHH